MQNQQRQALMLLAGIFVAAGGVVEFFQNKPYGVGFRFLGITFAFM